ncbi:MAG TPA: DUF4845 domain-containing protein [Rubrivivax sp.]|nr:DUF4845 domain-containing protein [Rubrivivax sp.]
MSRMCTAGFERRTRARQRGVTLFGLMFWAVSIGLVAYVLVRTVPTLNEYFTVQRAVEQVARSQPATVAEARAAFDKQKELEYSITSIAGKDLIITKENDKVVVAFAYDKLVPLYGPVYILIKYEGRSR